MINKKIKSFILIVLLNIVSVFLFACGGKNIKVLTGYYVDSDNTSITVDMYESNYISLREITGDMRTCKDFTKLFYWDDKHCYQTGDFTGKIEDTLCYWFLLDKNYNVLKGTDSLKEIAYSLYVPQLSYTSKGEDDKYVKEFVETIDGKAKTKHKGKKKLNYR